MSAAEAPPDRPERKGREESPLWSLLELAVLWTFAVAQPLFDLLKDNPEFLPRRLLGLDVISFAALWRAALVCGPSRLIGLPAHPVRRHSAPGALWP